MMRSAFIAAILLFSAAGAKAEISDDLKFCSRLNSTQERLACYDAAVRIEKAPKVLRQPSAQPIAGPIVSIAQPSGKSAFDGAYAGVTGGYDFRASRAFTQTTGFTFGSFPIAPYDSIHGANVGGILGLNATSGKILVGLEFSGRYNFGKSSADGAASFSQPLPFIFGTTCCSPQPLPQTLGSFQLAFDQRRSLEVSRPYAADASIRLGVIHQDMLFYGKIGAGFERSDSRFTTDDTQSRTCVNPIVQSTVLNQVTTSTVTGCQSILNGTSVVSTLTTGISPFVLLGAGFEQNFDQIFVRAEAQLQGHFIPGQTNSFYYTPSANLAVGYRF